MSLLAMVFVSTELPLDLTQEAEERKCVEFNRSPDQNQCFCVITSVTWTLKGSVLTAACNWSGLTPP